MQDGKAEAAQQVEALEAAKRKLEKKLAALSANSSALKEANAAHGITLEGLQVCCYPEVSNVIIQQLDPTWGRGSSVRGPISGHAAFEPAVPLPCCLDRVAETSGMWRLLFLFG